MTSVDARSAYWPEQWAIQVAVEADRIEYRMRVAQAAVPPDCRNQPSAHAVEHHLAMARTACRRTRRRRHRGLRDRWHGACVEQGFRNLHAAKIFLVDLLGDAEINAQIPEVCARMAVVLDRGDLRRVELEKALQSTDGTVRRAALKQAMETAYDASDEGYTRLRDFRNIIAMTAIVLMLAVGIMLLAVSFAPDAVPLCFRQSPVVVGADRSAGVVVCPSGERQSPSPGDVLIVAALGALGGGLAGLFAIRNLRGTSTPYSLPVGLAVLKVPSGALTAVAGLLLLGGGFAPGFSNLDSQRQILAYALVLGYAQQIITRFVDDRAQSILSKLPSKDVESAQPQGTAPATMPEIVPRPDAADGYAETVALPGAAAPTEPAPTGEPEPAPTDGPAPTDEPRTEDAPEAADGAPRPRGRTVPAR